MRFYVLFVLFLLLSSCKEKFEKPIFLKGHWKRTDDKPLQQTYEFWNKELRGIGFTLKNKDTTFKELMDFTYIEDKLFLRVKGVNENPTLFIVTNQTSNSFVCENPKNEFPKKIKYWLENNELKAEVSNPDFKIDFAFQKTN